MTKLKPTKKTSPRSEPIHQEFDVEMLYAAAEAHPDWEVMSDRTGLRHQGSEPPHTPSELLEWFLRKGRH